MEYNNVSTILNPKLDFLSWTGVACAYADICTSMYFPNPNIIDFVSYFFDLFELAIIWIHIAWCVMPALDFLADKP